MEKYEENSDVNDQIIVITETLVKAQEQAVPTKVTDLKGPKRKASPYIREILKRCKTLYKEWTCLGKPKKHQLELELRREKKELRKRQRIESAIDRIKTYSQIMENLNIQLFYRLI